MFRPSKIVIRIAVLVSVCLSAYLIAAAGEPATHPYHVTYTEIAFNPKSGNFEVALCVWPTDLETVLTKQESQPVDLDKTKNLDAMMERYIAKRFLVKPAVTQTSPDSSSEPVDVPADKQPDLDKDQATSKSTTAAKSSTKSSNTSKTDSQTPNSDSEKQATNRENEARPVSSIRWVGHEQERRHVWMYFEVRGDANQLRWTLENRVFTEVNDDQLNHVQWTIGKKEFETFVCSREKLKHLISLTDRLHGDRDSSSNVNSNGN
ncbi:MAG: DUF6702 family protein [Planctomycetota bacterium]